MVCQEDSWTTPPRLRELRLLRNFFLIAQPPLLLLRRGAWNPHPVLVCAQTAWLFVITDSGHLSLLADAIQVRVTPNKKASL